MTLEAAQSYALYAIWVLISLPTVVYVSYQLKENWNEEWLLRRRRLSILINCLLLFYIILIECPLYAIDRLNILPPLVYNIIFTISYSVKFWLASFVVLRGYFLYYDHEYNRTLNKNKWKILLNPVGLPKQATWWLGNRQRKYGECEWVLKSILLPATGSFTFIFIAVRITVAVYLDILNDFEHTFYYIYDVAFTFVWCTIAIILGTYFWKKYPSFADLWLIRSEISILLVIAIAEITQMIILFVIEAVVNVSLMQAAMCIYSIGSCCMLYILVIYPQTAKIRQSKSMRKKLSKSQKELEVSWELLVSTKEGFESFMGFLEKELSAENLLFILEYVQLKTKMLERDAISKKIGELNLMYDLYFPPKLPLSVIAKDLSEKLSKIEEEDWNRINEIAWDALNEIYDKYINEQTADLEVNISSRKRKAITAVYENDLQQKSIEYIMAPMENCVIEISALLNDSRTRFCEQIEFTELAVKMSKTQSGSNKDALSGSEAQIIVPSRTSLV